MMILQIFKATLRDEFAKKFDDLIKGVPSAFKPLISEVSSVHARILRVAPEVVRRTVDVDPDGGAYGREEGVDRSEVFTDGTGLFVVAVRYPDEPIYRIIRKPDGTVQRVGQGDPKKNFYLYSMTPQLNPKNLKVLSAFLGRKFGVRFSEKPYQAKRFEEFKNEGMQSYSKPTPSELAAAEVLADANVRKVTVALKAAGGLLLKDLPKQIPDGDSQKASQIRKHLLRSGLVSSEVVLICRKTQAQSFRFPSKSVLRETELRGVHCGCGRKLSEELDEEALAPTGLAQSLLEGSRWLSILVFEELRRLGIPADRILFGRISSGDEIDCLADISGEIALFELKDKEFNLGNAYSFGGKIGIVRPDHPVVVTTEKVGNDAKAHFARARAATEKQRFSIRSDDRTKVVRYVEGISKIRSDLSDLVTEVYSRDAAKILYEVFPLSLPDPMKLLAVVAKRNVSSEALPAGVVKSPKMPRVKAMTITPVPRKERGRMVIQERQHRHRKKLNTPR